MVNSEFSMLIVLKSYFGDNGINTNNALVNIHQK